MRKFIKSFPAKCVLIVAGLITLPVFAEVAVIVNSGYTGSLDTEQVTKLYLGKDKSLSPVMAADKVTDEFVEKALSRSASQYKAYWAKLAFTGGGRPPQTLDNSAAVITEVSSNPGTIGVIDAAAVTDSVKVVAKF